MNILYYTITFPENRNLKIPSVIPLELYLYFDYYLLQEHFEIIFMKYANEQQSHV